MGFFRRHSRTPPSGHITSIKRDVLETICDASRKMYPREFAGSLTASGDIINGLHMMPGAVSGKTYAIFNTYHLPTDFSRVGTVHSHPSPSARPSDEDLQLFRTFGRIHIIIAHPYNLHSWRVYDRSGEEKMLNVVP